MGPMHAMRVFFTFSKRLLPVNSRKFLTVDEEVKVSTSMSPDCSLFENASDLTIAFVNAFAGGAMLMMLANTMIPESYKNAGKLAGVFTVIGFIVSVAITILEKN